MMLEPASSEKKEAPRVMKSRGLLSQGLRIYLINLGK